MKTHIPVGAVNGTQVCIPLCVANRHGLIAGATGTGKTVTLQGLAHAFSLAGVNVFMADVKGDLSGIGGIGKSTPKIEKQLKACGVGPIEFQAGQVTYWDLFQKKGLPLRTTVSEFGPSLLSRILGLSDVQTDVLTLVFRIADSKKLLLIDLKDLREVVRFVGENADQFRSEYGNIAESSIGAIQRSLVALQSEGADAFLAEPALELSDMLSIAGEVGQINLLAADQLIQSPKLYSTFLLWMLSELFETLPEVGDLERPKLVFFFDEAHLLFKEAPKPLVEKIEQVVRLIRSKGVGVYFISQSPLDIPEAVLGQLGHRVQHALRAFTPADQKTVKAVASTMRANAAFSTAQVVTELSVGEALVSFLNDDGVPNTVERVFILPPPSQIGSVDEVARNRAVEDSPHFSKYKAALDRESAYELLKNGNPAPQKEVAQDKKQDAKPDEKTGSSWGVVGDVLSTHTGRTKRSQTVGQVLVKTVSRELVRGIFGTLLGGRRR